MKTRLKSYSSKILLKRMEKKTGYELTEITEILIGRGILKEENPAPDPKPEKPAKKSEPTIVQSLLMAKLQKGEKVSFYRKKTKETLKGVILNVRLDPRSNLIQYLIKTDKGVFGKSIVSEDVKFL